MTLKNTLLSRWNPRHDDVVHLKDGKEALTRVLDLYDAVRAEHTKISANTKLSGLGKQDAVRQFIGSKVAAELHLARARVDTMRANLAAWRQRLQPPSPDKSDVAGAVQRSEMRGVLRSAPNGTRIKLLLGDGADPMLQTAALEAPDFMSGLTADVRAQIETRLVEAIHPGQLTAIAEAEEVIDLVNAARTVTMNTVQAAGDFPDARTLDKFVNDAVGARAAQIQRSAEQTFASFGNFQVAA